MQTAVGSERKCTCISKDVEIIEGDLRDKTYLKTFFHVNDETETVVLHCASIVALGMEMPKIVMDINVGGTQNIIDKCLEHKECNQHHQLSWWFALSL